MEEKSVAIIFICHDNVTTRDCLQKLESSYILFVGDQPIDADLRMNSRVVIARELPDNIEYEKKLLTFTAWYAIVKNNLFTEYNYLCLFEYDIILDTVFESVIRNMTKDTRHDVITFIMTCGYFSKDINEDVLDEFIKSKGVTEPNKYKHDCWYNTTNHCVKRSVLDDFVNWYHPGCITIIKAKDLKKLSWYHERIFYMYMNIKDLFVVRINGIQHLYKNSHENFQ
jgi:hypothetical protein